MQPQLDGGTPETGDAAPGVDAKAPDATGPDGSNPTLGLDGAPDGTATPPDAGGTTKPDASMESGTDAAPDAADATADVVEEPSPPAPVQVLVINADGAESGVTIVFSDGAGALLTTAITDANGSVSQQLAAGSQVTALLGSSGAPNLVTVTGVKPGDVLKLLDGPFLSNSGTAAVTFAAYAQGDASVSDYQLASGSCSTTTGGEAGTFDYGLNPWCMNASRGFPVLAQAIGPDGGPLAWESGKGNLVTDGGVSPVDLSSATWSRTLGGLTLTLNNVSDSISPYASFTEFASTDSLSSVAYSTTNFGLSQIAAGMLQSTFALHPGFGDFDQVEAEYGTTQPTGRAFGAIADRVSTATVASPSTSDTIDVTDALPAITTANLDATNRSRPNFTWTSAAPLPAAGATVVQAQWQEVVDDAGDLKIGTWTIIVAASQSSVAPPAVPSATGFGPASTATWPDTFPIVLSMNGDAFPTYDAIRATAAQIGPALNVNSAPFIPPLPANGRARLTAFLPTPQQ